MVGTYDVVVELEEVHSPPKKQNENSMVGKFRHSVEAQCPLACTTAGGGFAAVFLPVARNQQEITKVKLET